MKWAYSVFIDPPTHDLPCVCVYRGQDEIAAQDEFDRLMQISATYLLYRFCDLQVDEPLPDLYQGERWDYKTRMWHSRLKHT